MSVWQLKTSADRNIISLKFPVTSLFTHAWDDAQKPK